MFESIKPGHIVREYASRLRRKANRQDSEGSLLGIIVYVLVMSFILLLFFICGWGSSTLNDENSVVITELMASNRSTIADEDGEYWDWIEVANNGESAVNLEGWGLSDDSSDPYKWTFPNITVGPGQHIIIFASGKDRKDIYGIHLHTNFRLSSKGESILLISNNGQTVKQLTFPELDSDISYGAPPAGSKDWLYFDAPTPASRNTTQGFDHPVQKSAAQTNIIKINEYMALNKSTLTDEDGEFCDWIEITNSSPVPVNLNGYGLSDDADKPFKWQFPDVSISPGQHIVIYASGKGRSERGKQMHTNFRLSQAGEELLLCNNGGQILDSVKVMRTGSNISYGRQCENPENWLFYTMSTPGRENNTQGFESLTTDILSGPGAVMISEASTINQRLIADDDGQYPAWVEITNQGDAAVNLKDYGLSDDEDTISKWKFPDIVINPGQHMMVFASGKNRYDPDTGIIHTSFKLNPGGELVMLSDSYGMIIDELNTGRLYPNISCGRLSDGSSGRVIFKTPTPGLPNNSETYKGFAAQPVFSNIGGFYKEPLYITLKTDSPGAIHYTLDGSEPTLRSDVYSSPILISKTTVVKARSFGDGLLPSITSANTFFINKEHTLTVVSISTNPENLWDEGTGIYATGYNASPEFPHVGANYWMDMEKPVHFELYEPDGKKGLGFDGGIKIFGAYSRAMDQKSFSIYARDMYGCDEINYPFFSDKPSITKFKSILLRTSGQDAIYTKVRDALTHKLVKDTEVDMQAYRPAVLYINGEYWGVYNIREKLSRFYLAGNHGVDPDNVDILQANGAVRYGSNKEYKELISFITSHDMSLAENYEYVKKQVDIENFIDYQITEIYCSNSDTGNIKFWRDRDGGKWRWLLYDTDWGFFNPSHNTLWFVINPEGTGTGKMFSTAIMYNLLKNEDFKDQFIQRFAYHLDNTFRADVVISVIDEMANAIAPEMPGQLARWGGTMEAWKNRVQFLRDFAVQRPPVLARYIIQQFSLSTEEIEKYGITL